MSCCHRCCALLRLQVRVQHLDVCRVLSPDLSPRLVPSQGARGALPLVAVGVELAVVGQVEELQRQCSRQVVPDRVEVVEQVGCLVPVPAEAGHPPERMWMWMRKTPSHHCEHLEVQLDAVDEVQVGCVAIGEEVGEVRGWHILARGSSMGP